MTEIEHTQQEFCDAVIPIQVSRYYIRMALKVPKKDISTALAIITILQYDNINKKYPEFMPGIVAERIGKSKTLVIRAWNQLHKCMEENPNKLILGKKKL